MQGVGFRPFVYRQAVALGLTGFVLNDSAGVLIEVEGPTDDIDALCRQVLSQPPPLAQIAGVEERTIPTSGSRDPFRIVASPAGGDPSVPVSVDTATCAACLAEVDDPDNRRYRYPFTNCTDCGPRYTIIQRVPYDRPATTMAGFVMCAECQAEYDDPADRRFHAQPNACAACGPRLTWATDSGPAAATGDDALLAAGAALREGKILAVKGLGGYHLAVDAFDAPAVALLRRRKHRDEKPFALMVPSPDDAAELCSLSPAGWDALTSPGRPIVIGPRRPSAVAAGVAPGLPELGLMLPYTALHHLLLREVGHPIVLTSGNLSDEPIAHQDDDAFGRLGPLVDGVLSHDRAIHIRCDDSVVRDGRDGGGVQILRRSRGFAPQPVDLPAAQRASADILAVGAELKNTISVARGGRIVSSHHVGDLEHLATYQSFLQAVEHLCHLTGARPGVVAHDLHPEYLSTKFAVELDLQTIAVQHHHAHVASCLVDHGQSGPVLGLAFDGLGMGEDGALWGGEFLAADLAGYERAGHLLPIVMPGGTMAIREPWRMAVAWAHAAGCSDAVRLLDERASAVLALVERGSGRAASPVTTSVGRLFDAAAALIGVRLVATYEGQAAIELEALARSVPAGEGLDYPVDIRVGVGEGVLDPRPLIAAIIDDLAAGRPREEVAAGFHDSLARAAAALAVRLAGERGLRTAALTGGVFQNTRLSSVVGSALADAGIEVLVHGRIPPNDGGISVGQAAVAAANGCEEHPFAKDTH